VKSSAAECVGTVQKGRFIPADPVSYAITARYLEGKPVCLKRLFGKRSRKQGNAWHGIVVPIYMQCMGHTNHDFAHYELVKHIRPMVTVDIKGREVISPTPTKDMDTKESMELYKDAQDFLSIEYGVYVPDPDPNWKGFSS
jgi:hypothetical protein